jgi:Na+-translocating ferredoxin:NAD+ oxidoreductase RnfA subunit
MTALPRAMRGAPALVLSVGLLALAMSGLRGVG